MKYKLLIISVYFTLILLPALRADEGMWIPVLIEKYNIKLMQEKGFKLTSEDIYSVNKACMKDAIVHFGGGCTGEVISSDGLLITNHHCGGRYRNTPHLNAITLQTVSGQCQLKKSFLTPDLQ